LGSPVKPMFNGSIPIGLTADAKLCLSSVSFRHSTGICKSQDIGSTGERKYRSVLVINRRFDQSTGEFFFSSIGSTGVQMQIYGVSGELNRRIQPVFKPYASDQPALKKFAGPTCHISLLPADAHLTSFAFPTRLAAAARSASPAPPIHTASTVRRRRSTPPLCARAAPPRHAARASSAPPALPLRRVTAVATPRRRHLSDTIATACAQHHSEQAKPLHIVHAAPSRRIA
jgi:hypothetical protein